MTTPASATERKHRRLLAIGQFVLLPFLSFIGAAWAAGFPWVDSFYPFESRSIQCAAILTALCSGLTIAIAFRATALHYNHLLRHLVVVVLALLGGHLLWVEPIWGFHHDQTLGIFAWLFIGGEDGLWIMPNVLGLPLTVASFIGYIVVLRALVASPQVT